MLIMLLQVRVNLWAQAHPVCRTLYMELSNGISEKRHRMLLWYSENAILHLKPTFTVCFVVVHFVSGLISELRFQVSFKKRP
jgi:hypothetical protein